MEKQILGIDTSVFINNPSFFKHNFLETPPVPNAFVTIGHLAYKFFRNRAWIVSRCSPTVAERILAWFEYHDFYNSTGIIRDHLKFYARREDKPAICSEIGITHFIASKLEVLGCLIPVVNHRFLINARTSEIKRFSQFLPHVQRVTNWEDIENYLLEQKQTQSPNQ